MFLRNLAYLAALARERHFARAAAACGVAQPTLSAGLKQLEEELGILIVLRGQRFGGFTPEGERVLAWARRILSDCDSLRQEASVMRAALVGRLRLGVVPAAAAIVPLLTDPFTAAHPDVQIEVRSLSADEIQRGLDTFEVDAGVSYLDAEALSGVRRIPLYEEHYLFVSSVPGAFAEKERLTWEEAATMPLVLMPRTMQNRRLLDARFAAHGAQPRIAIEADSLVTLGAYLRHGQWSSIVPHHFLASLAAVPTLRALPLVEDEEAPVVGLVLPERDPLTASAQALVQVARALNVPRMLEQGAAP